MKFATACFVLLSLSAAAAEVARTVVTTQETSTNSSRVRTVRAVRSDGASSRTVYTFDASGKLESVQRYVDADGWRAMSDDTIRAKSTSKSQRPRVFAVGPDSDAGCETAKGGGPVAFGSALVGRETVEGYDTAHTRMENGALDFWYAPALGCEVIRMVARVNGGEITQRLERATLGEPEASWFETPAGYDEVPPSEFAARLARRAGVKMPVVRYEELDRHYHAWRP